MKKSQILAALAFAFALGVAMPVLSVAHAPLAAAIEGEPEVPQTSCGGDPDAIRNVSTATDLKSALENPSVTWIYLDNDINLNVDVDMTRDSWVFLNLNGHNLTISSAWGIYVWQGHLQIIDTEVEEKEANKAYNTITVTSGRGIGVVGSSDPSATDYASVTIDAGVEISGTTVDDSSYAIALFNANSTKVGYGLSATIKGKVSAHMPIYVQGNIQNKDNPVKVTIADGAEVHGDETGGIYAAGYAEWTIDAAYISAGTPIAAKSGHFNINNATIYANGTPIENPESQNSGMETTGAVFQVEHNSAYAGDIAFNINGGVYTSQNGNVFDEYGTPSDTSAPVDVNITAGTFSAMDEEKAVFGGNTENQDITITGGTFKGSDTDTFAENGYIPEDAIIDENGNVATDPASEPSNQSDSSKTSSSSSTSTKTIASSDGLISVTGKLPAGTKVNYSVSEQSVSLFGTRKYVMYNIDLVNASNQKISINSPVTVKINVPTDLNGGNSSIYYVRPDLRGIERLYSNYNDGMITFTTSHFSYYAIVEDNGQIITGATQNTSSEGITDASAPNAGIVATSDSNASSTVAMVAGVITALTAAGAGVVAYRGARRSTRK